MQEEKVYIGTKIVKAFPMTRNDWIQGREDIFPEEENQHGYCVIYEDGYKSWSPKGTFERAYREITSAEKILIG